MTPWTTQQALEVMMSLGQPYRDNGYSLALYGSVPERGRSNNDLDMIAVPADDTTTHPEQMERLMCEKLNAKPNGSPIQGLLGTWSRAVILEDGRMIDIQYRLLPEKPAFAIKMEWEHVGCGPYHWI